MASFKEDVIEHASAVYQTVEDEVKSWTELLKEVWPLLILLLIGLLLLIWFAKPAPPKKVLMATGTGGSYKVLGEKYQEYFKKKGIQIELIPTHGSSENLHHLIDRNDPIQVALVQGGMIAQDGLSGVESLGSVDYEPVWLFYRNNAFDSNKRILDSDLIKLKIGIGPVGSGTHVHALNILKLNNMPATGPNLIAMGNSEGVQALQNGQLDALLLVDGFESPNVQALIKYPGIHLATFNRANAYTRLEPYFEELTVPMGGFDLGSNTPDHPVQLISTTTNLLID